ncbi:sodium- and chloride-dependent glycine transporter 2-like [Ornithodoros turicata]|uniref:sodium- and chloride-dependent glycine transporter 2-like n=1 Tax=Ornithodoros turicata TaxID=34597 RepID=UPI00313986E8
MSLIFLSFEGHFEQLMGQPLNRVIAPYAVTTVYTSSAMSLDARPILGFGQAAAIFFFILMVNAFSCQFLTTEIIFDELLHSCNTITKIHNSYRVVFYVALLLLSIPCFTELAVSYEVRLKPSTQAKYVIFMVVFEIFTFFRGYGLQRVLIDYDFMLRHPPSTCIRICWATITPLVIATSLLYLVFNVQNFALPTDNDEYSKDNWKDFIVLCAVLVFVLLYACCLYRDNEYSQTVEALFKPASSWGPRNKFLAMDYRERIAVWEEGRRQVETEDTMLEPLLPYYTTHPSSLHSFQDQSFVIATQNGWRHSRDEALPGASPHSGAQSPYSGARTPSTQLVGTFNVMGDIGREGT